MGNASDPLQSKLINQPTKPDHYGLMQIFYLNFLQSNHLPSLHFNNSSLMSYHLPQSPISNYPKALVPAYPTTHPYNFLLIF